MGGVQSQGAVLNPPPGQPGSVNTNQGVILPQDYAPAAAGQLHTNVPPPQVLPMSGKATPQWGVLHPAGCNSATGLCPSGSCTATHKYVALL